MAEQHGPHQDAESSLTTGVPEAPRASPGPGWSPGSLRPSGPVLGLLALLGLFVLLLAGKGQLANFLSLQNVQVLLHRSSLHGVLALGALVIIISGGIDLS